MSKQFSFLEGALYRGGVACGLGALLVLTLPPFNGVVLWVFLYPLLLALIKGAKNFKGAWTLGYAFGLGYFVPGLYWVSFGISLDPTYYWLIPFALLGLPAYLSLFIAFPLAFAWRLGNQKSGVYVLSAATFLTIGEVLRGTLLTGCPWNPFGLGLVAALPMAQVASVLGVYGLSFATMLVSSAFFFLGGANKNKIACGGLVILGLALWVWGAWRLARNPFAPTATQVTLVQPNFVQKVGYTQAEKLQHFSTLVAMSGFIIPQFLEEAKDENRPPRLIVWPESAVPFIYNKMPQLEGWLQNYLKPEQVLIFGTTRVHEGAGGALEPYNSLGMLSKNGGPAKFYDKQHLLPFGEYVPFEPLLSQHMGLKAITGDFLSFKPGAGPSVHSLPHGLPPVQPSICFEAIFPGAQKPKAERAAWMVNTTNDAWFGQSLGPYQHFQMARLRAIEEGLPMVRVAVTGISGLVDPLGRVVVSIPLNIQKSITTALPEPLKNRPFFARHGHLGLWGIMAFCWAFLWIFWLIRGRFLRQRF